ncbi:hypothetical protein RFI_36284 [Reticulomyxa filosa]|uniref:RGS domain-containing protein n=1 Tax=Reticulomyxa filosa TaxID=46433 RepID=X6LIF0_RETFI|nr:hypothetical protein RFI_36284 [Reticulomyxa filosa]|eukprot:ETO01156.1 hypothetical protein RFI_36284 [Reticulomyxa filosa]
MFSYIKIGWVLTSFQFEEKTLYPKLRVVAKTHQEMGVQPEYYGLFVEVLHETLSEIFECSYTVTVRYCVDRIFTLVMCIMMGYDLQELPKFYLQISASTVTNCNMKWLDSLENTIHDPIGFQYLCRFLEAHSCSEYVWFLKLYLEFDYAMSDKQRLVIVRKLIDCCMTPGELFEINISHEMREQVLFYIVRCNC